MCTACRTSWRGSRKDKITSRDRQGAVLPPRPDGRASEVGGHNPWAHHWLTSITFHCYGTWHQGDEPGSVDRDHNQVGTDFLPPDPETRRLHEQNMDQPAYQLDAQRRDTVMRAIQEVCEYRGWRLQAAHVRSTHVHVVVTANHPPEKVMNDFKAYSSRALSAARLDAPNRKRWSRHGSTRYLNNEGAVVATVEYVLRRQGEPMTVYDESTSRCLQPPREDEPRPCSRRAATVREQVLTRGQQPDWRPHAL